MSLCKKAALAARRSWYGAVAARGMSSLPAQESLLGSPELPAFDFTPPPYTGPPKEEVLSMRKQYLSPGTAISVDKFDFCKLYSKTTI